MGCETASHDRPKPKHRKGLWSPEEDQRLRSYILKHGLACWTSVPFKAGLERNGKSCRLRWINYLRPGLKRGTFSNQEQDTILALHHMLGNKWSKIAQHLPGRTDNEVKNFWHSYLKKKLEKQQKQKQKQKQPSSTQYSTTSTTLDSADSSTTHSIDSPKPYNNNNSLSKLFFAEWLGPDHQNPTATAAVGSMLGQSSSGFGNEGGLVGNNNFDNVGSLGLELENGTIMDSLCDHVKFEDQISNGLGNYGCVDEQLLHFGNNNGFMYI